MKAVLLILSGVVGGVLGGLGLGGGTLMIPLLIHMGVSAPLAAEVNLLSFLPMSVVALILHVRQKRVDGWKVFFLAFFAIAGAILAALLFGRVSGIFLKRLFGWFLIVIGVVSLLSDLAEKRKKSK